MKKIFLLAVLILSSVFLFKESVLAVISIPIKEQAECEKNSDCKEGFRCSRGRCVRIAYPTNPPPQPTTPPPLPTTKTQVVATPIPSPTPSSPTPTVTPNITVTPGPEAEMIVPLTGTGDYCQAIAVNKSTLNLGQYLVVTSTAKTGDFTDFGYVFYNLDNLDTAGKPKPIMFTSGKTYAIGKHLSVTTNTQSVNLRFEDIDKKDLNWNFYMPKPKNIRVDAYFKNVNSTWSKTDPKCQITFKTTTVDPTPTPNAACVCAAAGTCATACFFDKFPAPTGFAYSSPIKCSLGNDLFSSVPTSDNKNNWCRAYFKTKGDANGDGRADLLDYFYYKSVRYGAKVPPTVNVDFDGDGFVTDLTDKAVILKSL